MTKSKSSTKVAKPQPKRTGLRVRSAPKKGNASPVDKAMKTVMAPAAASMQYRSVAGKQVQTAKGVTVSHTELLFTAISPNQGGTAYKVLNTINIQPGAGELSQWLAPIAIRYDKYQITKMDFRLVSTQPTTTPGTFMMCTDVDCLDQPPLTEQEFLATQNAVESPAWSGITHNIPRSACYRSLFISDGVVPQQADLKTYNAGKFYLACLGVPVGTTVRLYVDYTIEFSVPQLRSENGLVKHINYYGVPSHLENDLQRKTFPVVQGIFDAVGVSIGVKGGGVPEHQLVPISINNAPRIGTPGWYEGVTELSGPSVSWTNGDITTPTISVNEIRNLVSVVQQLFTVVESAAGLNSTNIVQYLGEPTFSMRPSSNNPAGQALITMSWKYGLVTQSIVNLIPTIVSILSLVFSFNPTWTNTLSKISAFGIQDSMLRYPMKWDATQLKYVKNAPEVDEPEQGESTTIEEQAERLGVALKKATQTSAKKK